MTCGFIQCQDGGKTSVSAFQKRAPMLSGLAQEQRRHAGFQIGPVLDGILIAQRDIRQAELVDQDFLKLRLQRPQADVCAISTAVHVIKR